MGDVIDMRADTFLRAMRETGSWEASCKQAGMTSEEVEELCKDSKYDLAQIECQLQFIEDLYGVTLEKLKSDSKIQLKNLRDTSMNSYRERHGVKS